jgi:hypothetical protein
LPSQLIGSPIHGLYSEDQTTDGQNKSYRELLTRFTHALILFILLLESLNLAHMLCVFLLLLLLEFLNLQ